MAAIAQDSEGQGVGNAPARALLGEPGSAAWQVVLGRAVEARPDGPQLLEISHPGGSRWVEFMVGQPLGGVRVVVLREAGADGANRRRLERGLEFERLLTRSSARLMRTGESRLDEEIEHVLESVGRFFDVDRAYVFTIDERAGTQSNTHEWTAAGITREAPNLQGLPLDTFPWLLAELRRDAVFRYARLADLPPEASAERQEFEREGIQSILIVPLWTADELRGFIGFDAVRRRVEWDESYVVGLRLLAQMLAGAIDARTLARQLRRQAMHDALTGLPNRLYLRHRFGPDVGWKPDAVVAVVDVDDFKVVNDAHGHGAGDAVLRELGRRLSAVVGEEGVVARVGGDEFVVVEPRPRESAARIAAHLVAAASEPFELAGGLQRVGISVGLVQGGVGDGLDGLLDRADGAMYRAKASGKNRWVVEARDVPVAELDAVVD